MKTTTKTVKHLLGDHDTAVLKCLTQLCPLYRLDIHMYVRA